MWERLQPRLVAQDRYRVCGSHGQCDPGGFPILMAPCGPLYFGYESPQVRRPYDLCEGRYRCVRSNVVRSAATQDAKASGERCERAKDGERS